MGRHIDYKELVEDYIHEKTRCLVSFDLNCITHNGAYYKFDFEGTVADLILIGNTLQSSLSDMYIECGHSDVLVELHIKESWKEIVERLEIEHALL